MAVECTSSVLDAVLFLWKLHGSHLHFWGWFLTIKALNRSITAGWAAQLFLVPSKSLQQPCKVALKLLELHLCSDYSNFSSDLIFFQKQDLWHQALGATPQFSIKVLMMCTNHKYAHRAAASLCEFAPLGIRCCKEQQWTLEGGERHRDLDLDHRC